MRKLTIIAQDPSVTTKDKDGVARILTEQIDVPEERLRPGPTGCRLTVVDYDVTPDVLYAPAVIDEDADAYAGAPDDVLLGDPRFHAQNVYAIAMRTLARFEFALGRRVPWGCVGHQIHVAPHAFADANAFYSREDRAILFGYFAGRPRADGAAPTIFTCLSHDVVAHETTHAILDGLRPRYLEPSSPDQAAFHEGFADVVALLSIFSLRGVVGKMLGGDGGEALVEADALDPDRLRRSALFGLAEQMGQELAAVRGSALRNSLLIEPDPRLIESEEYREEHRRGELLVAAMIRSFFDVWTARIARIGTLDAERRFKDRMLVVEEGAKAAEHLLTMAIRAIDYCPPVDLGFADFLSALLTVDREVEPQDVHAYRPTLLRNFAAFGIAPRKEGTDKADGTWTPWDRPTTYSRTHFDSLLRDKEEVFRFIWENNQELGVSDQAYIEVQNIWPSMRVAPDGFLLRETIADYVQILTLTAGELRQLRIKLPAEVDPEYRLRLYGGGTLVFDEYGQLKYHIANHVRNSPADRERQGARLRHLWESGYFDGTQDVAGRFALMHMLRGGGAA